VKFFVVHIRECYTLSPVKAQLHRDRLTIAFANKNPLSITYIQRVITSVTAMKQLYAAEA